MSLPFRTATTPTGAKTHLVLHSPRVTGLSPDDLNQTTLCCHAVAAPAETPIGDVECRLCLILCPRYMTWPTFVASS